MLICLIMIIYIFIFPCFSSDFCFIYLCFFVVRGLVVYSVYLLCELYFLSLKISKFKESTNFEFYTCTQKQHKIWGVSITRLGYK